MEIPNSTMLLALSIQMYDSIALSVSHDASFFGTDAKKISRNSGRYNQRSAKGKKTDIMAENLH